MPSSILDALILLAKRYLDQRYSSHFSIALEWYTPIYNYSATKQ